MPGLTYINLSQVYLWPENPRLFDDKNENEQQAIVNLVEQQNTTQGNKLLVLTESILEDGIIEPIGVVKYEDGFIEVREGNRRIACLKLLKSPYILPESFKKIRNKFIELQDNLNEEIFTNIPAKIYNENEVGALENWIELKHAGLQGGKGIDRWGSMEKENWKKYRGLNTPLLDFQNYLVSKNILTIEQVRSVYKTNWERILGSVGREFLGIRYKDNKYEIIIDIDKFKYKVNKIINSLAGKSVSIVYNNERIKEFFSSLNFERENMKTSLLDNVKDDKNNSDKINIFELNHKEETTEKPFTNKRNNNTVNDIETASEKNKRAYTSNTAGFLTNITCSLKSSQDTDGIIRLIRELKNMSKTKDYKEYPIATAMLMRSLLEQCLIYYLKKRKKWRKFKKQYSNLGLQQIINKFIKDEDIFEQDRELKRYFNILINNPGTKDYFDMIVHNSHKVAANSYVLDIIAETGYLSLIQYIIDFNIEK
jgi:hypothetical protein